ncbi:MAG: PEP-CTERM sorting domain-containing protein [Candidatus Polarisedimenticolaceae bacterium]|nr:PEP-CTERM sorting domain-containing protein [Candidatus Polarisedimenticolaceae bacterium]
MEKVIRSILFACVFLSPSAYSLTISGTDEVNVNSAESYVYAYDSSILNTDPGADIAWLYGYDSSTLNIDDGETSWLFGHDSSTLNIDGGDIGWLKVYEDSQANISYVDDLSWLLVNDDAVVNIYGSAFNYSSGHLSGMWSNGESFSFWALEEVDLNAGNIGSILPDNIVLHTVSVPEPSSVALFGAGIMLFGLTRRKSKKAS